MKEVSFEFSDQHWKYPYTLCGSSCYKNHKEGEMEYETSTVKIKGILDSTKTPKFITLIASPCPSLSGATMHRTDTAGSDYQVPAGRKFIPLALVYCGSSSGRVEEIYESTAANSKTGQVNRVVINSINDSITTFIHVIPDAVAFSSSKYVTHSSVSGFGMINFYLFGIEEAN